MILLPDQFSTTLLKSIFFKITTKVGYCSTTSVF